MEGVFQFLIAPISLRCLSAVRNCGTGKCAFRVDFTKIPGDMQDAVTYKPRPQVLQHLCRVSEFENRLSISGQVDSLRAPWASAPMPPLEQRGSELFPLQPIADATQITICLQCHKTCQKKYWAIKGQITRCWKCFKAAAFESHISQSWLWIKAE
jgi:hypothetical protein